MGRKYTKRLSKRMNTKRKNTRRKNTLKSRVSKRKNTLNRRNNLKRLRKKRSYKKRLFKGGARWQELYSELDDLLNRLDDDKSDEANEVKKSLYQAVVGDTNYPSDKRELLLNITRELANMGETKLNMMAPIYIASLKDLYNL